MKGEITTSTTIGEAIFRKGTQAGEVFDELLCDGVKACYSGTALQIGHAAEKMGKEHVIPELLERINSL